ncbi:MAG TPA: type II toxin-antitoxin system HicB family antitoxin [Verrucomicrobiae bacterium]
MRYAVVYEKSENGYAYVPDLPCCIAAGKIYEETVRLITEEIAFYLEGLREDGQPIPEPTSVADYVAVAV